MRIGVLVAMDKEFEQLSTLSIDGIVVRKTGMCKVNAAVNATRLILDYHPDIIVSSGCAGGARTDMDVMDVVVSSRIAYHDVYCGIEDEIKGRVQGLPHYFETPANIVEKALDLKYDGKIHAGLIASGDWFVDSLQKMNEIKALYPDAVAVDMESAALAQTCHLFNTPFVSFRVISDVPAKENSLATYKDFWNTVSEHSFEVTSSFLKKLQEM
ncbi:MAG: 5'-methylthioadenosine/S-adenosylhomocysteine nucleosidase [Bacteroidaceae bacterium]|nr:5'-methylthioadenosine/S-adenosylhomocysteine nucleosidase [Bacteroidaceae bacterium]